MDSFLVGIGIVLILFVIFIYHTIVSKENAAAPASVCTPACPTGQQCVSGACVTPGGGGGGGTPPNLVCGSGYCTYGQWCDNGTCTAKNSCTNTSNCESGQFCFAGMCQTISQPSTCGGMIEMNGICQWCTDADQCSSGQSCIGGYCVPTECQNSSSCVPPNFDGINADTVFTCNTSNQCTVTSLSSSCIDGQYFNGRLCDNKPTWCLYDSDCNSSSKVCYNNMCLPSCDINVPNSCSVDGSSGCVPTNSNNYVYGEESFSAACANCTNQINCFGANVKCSADTDCPSSGEIGMSCNRSTGFCYFPIPTVKGASCPDGYYANSSGICTANPGLGCFKWTPFNMTTLQLSDSDTTKNTYLFTGNDGSSSTWTTYLTSYPGSPPIGISMIGEEDSPSTVEHMLPCVFTIKSSVITDKDGNAVTSYAPMFGYYNFYSGSNIFASWDNGSALTFYASEVESAYYIQNTCTTHYSEVPLHTSTETIPNDKFMTFYGIPFCYNIPGSAGFVGSNGNTYWGPSVFTAFSGGKCVVPYLGGNGNFGYNSIDPAVVYNSFVDSVPTTASKDHMIHLEK